MTDQLLPPIVRLMERSHAGRASLRAIRWWRAGHDQSRARVLCVGFQKTGTSSFGRAMKQLGFSHYGYDRDLHHSLLRGDVDRCLRFAAHFDSLDDLPWSSPTFVAAYRDRYPASRYVLLERNEQDWLRSYFRYFGCVCTEQEALAGYRDHNRSVLDLLAGERLLRMNVCAGEGFEVLCPFLGIEAPRSPFPWENRGTRPGLKGGG
jgi:hypothetical protein